MALAITDKPNTSTPDADYPFGNIRDKTVSVAGTSVNKLVYADFHQFFAKLMDYAGVTPNGTPDNETNGFQLMEALMELMGNVKTEIIEIGTWDMDTTQIKNVTFPFTINNIKSISAVIFGTAGGAYDAQTYAFMGGGSACYFGGNNAGVNLSREASGFF